MDHKRENRTPPLARVKGVDRQHPTGVMEKLAGGPQHGRSDFPHLERFKGVGVQLG